MDERLFTKSRDDLKVVLRNILFFVIFFKMYTFKLNYLNSFSILSTKKCTNLKVSPDRLFHKIIVVILDSIINFHGSLIKMMK